MLQIICGPMGSGKTEYVYSQIEKNLTAGKEVRILVPEQFSLFMEKELLRRFGMQAQTQLKVLSFSRLCNMVLSNIGPLRMKYIDGAGRQIIAAQVMEKLSGKLNVLGRNLHQKGFAQVICETISELKRYGVTPQGLKFAAEEVDSPEFSAKLEELSVIYELYNNLIEESSSDAEDNLSLVCTRLRECDFLKGKLYIMHFRSFTPVEYAALGSIMQRMDVYFCCEYSNDKKFSGLFAPVEETIRRLRETAAAENIEELSQVSLSCMADEDLGDIEYLRDNYFNTYALPKPYETNEIHIYEPQNLYREIEAAADLILRLCRTENRRFSEFLILSRDDTRYRQLVPAVFEKRGIPVFIDTRRSICSKPLIRFISAVIEVLAYGPSYERIIPMARAGILDIERDHIDAFENYILAVAPSYAMWQTDRWEYAPERSNFDLEKVNSVKDKLLSGVKHIEGKISGTKTGGEIAAALLEWLQQGGIAERVEALAQAAADDGLTYISEEYEQVWNCAVSVLAQISKLMETTPMTYQKFIQLWAASCGGIEMGMTPQTIDCVTFSRIDRFRSDGSKVVLVLGMNEGDFPKGHMTEGFISDDERHKLSAIGLELAPGAESKRRQEQLLIYAVLSAAKERLYMFRHLEDDSGKPLQQSEIISRTEELFPKIERINPDANEDILLMTEGSEAMLDRLTGCLSEYGGRLEDMPLPLQELYEWFGEKENYRERLAQLKRAMSAPKPEKLSADLVEKLYGQVLSLSASQLETYNSCAFKYFLTYGLLASERDIAGLEPRSMGSVQHAALYNYFTDLKEKGVDPGEVDKESCFRAMSEAVDIEARNNSELLYEASAYYKYIVMRMKGIAARTAWEVLKFYRSSQFRPYGFEIKIGFNGDIPALSVKTPQGKEIAKIRGLIDRADTASVDGKNLVSIIDYKSSAKALDVQLAEDGITLQPLLYTSALCDAIENSAPAAMVYMQMTDPIIEEKDYLRKGEEAAINGEIHLGGWITDDDKVISAYNKNPDKTMGSFMPKGVGAVVEKEELEKRIKKANERIYKSAEEILSGEIGANPYVLKNKHDACSYCLYSGICQKDE